MGTLIDCLRKSKLSPAYQKRLTDAANNVRGELGDKAEVAVVQKMLGDSEAELASSLKQLGIDPNQQAAPAPEPPAATGAAQKVEKPKEKLDPKQAIEEPRAAPESDEVPRIPAQTALNMREIKAFRSLLGMLDMTRKEQETWASVVNAVKIDGSWTGAMDLANAILEKDHTPDARNHSQMILFMVDRENRYESALNEEAIALQEGNTSRANEQSLTADMALVEMNVILDAAQRGGTRLGRALNMRKLALDRATYEIVPLLRRATRVKGEQLTTEERKELEQFSRKVLDLESEVNRLTQELGELQAKTDREGTVEFINEGVRTRSRAGQQNAKERRAEYKNELKALGFHLNAVADNFSPKAMDLIAKIAETYIEEGASKLHEVTGKIKADIRDITDNDIYNALSGRLKKAKEKIRDEQKQRIKELKQQAKLWAEIHDAINGVFPEGKGEEQVGSIQVQALRDILGKLRFQARKTIRDSTQIAHFEKKLKDVTDQLEGGWREFEPEFERKKQNERVNDLKAQIKDVLREMSALDALYDVEGRQREGEALPKRETRAETNPRIAEFRKRAREIRKEMREESSRETADEKKRKSLKERAESLREQIDGEFRNLKSQKDAKETPEDIEQLQEEVALLGREMSLRDAIYDLNARLESGDVSETEKSAGRTNQTIQLLEDEAKNLRSELAKLRNAPKSLEKLKQKLADVQAQLAGGFRYIKDTKEKRKTTVEAKELQSAIRELETLMRTTDAGSELERQLRENDFPISAGERKIVRSAELEDAQVRKRQLQREIEKRINAKRKLTTGEKIVEGLMVPRALQSTMDMSWFGRQGLFLVVNDPASAGRAFVGGLQALLKEYNHDRIANFIENSEYYKESLRAGIEYSELDSILSRREEHFMSNIAEKFRVLGPMVRAGNRSMITGLNILRYEAYKRHAEAIPNATIEERKAWAFYVNSATGKGQLGKARGIVSYLNVAMYAPKLAVSRYQVLYAPFGAWKHEQTRKMIAKDIAKFYGFYMTALLLAAGMGADVEIDPESSDFGKIKVGNTRFDIGGGMQQPTRVVALFGKGVINRGEVKKRATSLMIGFLDYKLNPAITVPQELATGVDFRGQPVDVFESVAGAVTPLILQDVWDALREEPALAPAVAAAVFVGAGASTYEKKSSGSRSSKYPQ